MKLKKILGGILIVYGTFGMGICLMNIYQKGSLIDFKICGVAMVGILLFFVGLSFFKTIKKQNFFDTTNRRLTS